MANIIYLRAIDNNMRILILSVSCMIFIGSCRNPQQVRNDDHPAKAMLHELPLLSLPADLEKLADPGVAVAPLVIRPNQTPGDTRFGYTLYGVLSDTSRFYAVLWRTRIDLKSDEQQLMVTTISKDGIPIATAMVRTNGDVRYDQCHSEGSITSIINKDLSYKSSYTGVLFCDGEESNYDSIVAGKINDDGSITVVNDKQ